MTTTVYGGHVWTERSPDRWTAYSVRDGYRMSVHRLGATNGWYGVVNGECVSHDPWPTCDRHEAMKHSIEHMLAVVKERGYGNELPWEESETCE